MNEDKNQITYFAETDFRNKKTPFGIKASDRTRHVYTIGKTGMGKSTMLENMAIQDIQNGNGLAFVDPHGKSADLLLDYIPEDRIKDVIYFAPFDTDYPISFNVMEDVGYDKRFLVANGLMSAFKKIWVDAWSARMEYILGNILLALLEYPGSTLLGVNRMLSDKDYRKKVVDNITDPSVKSFWVDEFAKYGDKYMQEAGAAIQNKIGQFVSNPIIRNIIGQPKSNFDIRQVMDGKKIMIINLSKGQVGEANANLIGSMLITKIYLAAMSRADVSEDELKKLPNFYFFVDEFQSFANESFADILSEARKYKLNLIIAHQYIEQMPDEVRAAVFGNVGTMIIFRVGSYDAEIFEKEFAPAFTADDIVNLGYTQIYLKLMIDGIGSAPFSAVTLPPIKKPDVSYRKEIIDNSRSNFSKLRADVEREIMEWHAPVVLEKKTDSVVRTEEKKTPMGYNERQDAKKRLASTDGQNSGYSAVSQPSYKREESRGGDFGTQQPLQQPQSQSQYQQREPAQPQYRPQPHVQQSPVIQPRSPQVQPYVSQYKSNVPESVPSYISPRVSQTPTHIAPVLPVEGLPGKSSLKEALAEVINLSNLSKENEIKKESSPAQQRIFKPKEQSHIDTPNKLKLKEALGEVIGDVKKTSSENISEVRPKSSSEDIEKPKQIKEIPEDVLKKVLEV